jgi:hypothetical protein
MALGINVQMTPSITKICHYAECHVFFAVLNVDVLSVVKLNVLLLGVFMLIVMVPNNLVIGKNDKL